MLQVGAMRIEGNADELSNSLKRKGFPVFVLKRSTDRFYRVAVGPYADMSSAKRVADELQRENVEAILKRWMPE
jgi:cell division septation protein DedD